MADDTYNQLLWQSLLSDRPETSLNPQANLYEPHVPLTGGVARERLSQDAWQTLGALRQGLSPRSAGVDVLAPPPPERAVMSGEVQPAPWYADPVELSSQMMAPHLLPYVRGVGEMFAGRELGAAGRLSLLKGEAGNLGPVPRNAQGEPLPESVARDASGKLQKYYHGTRETFPDFDLAHANPTDWARGVFTTSDPAYSEGYALGHWPQRSREAYSLMQNAQDDAAYYRRLAQEESDPARAAAYEQQAWGYNEMAQDEWRTLQDLIEQDPQRHTGAPQIRAVYHDVRKPLELNDPADPTLSAEVAQLRKDQGRTLWAERSNWTNRHLLNAYTEMTDPDQAQAWLASHGYDAFHEYLYSHSTFRHHEVMTPFSPSQVYPAANVEGGG